MKLTPELVTGISYSYNREDAYSRTEAFSYGIRHFSLNHNEICRIPSYENASRMGVRILPNTYIYTVSKHGA